ncbi:hypothetical protein A3H09_02530 [Candidatus Falkowbacteria bacterium RIFCSPLOWO2_12_FULL_45_13]|uniref:Uncharacterized protein n=2 Tax=Candidatus Falkowiibacteriota TaxID=1752728 RepID=A0A1F5SBV9_9BACT|nr:MAG: hypothetical protein A3H66_00745 [Candidatus Falkowbacteria bacterium RIFCSPLOWO2_02_FULL_45_21]OGF30569.1 MAG: hypothetical protein A3H09_02530 [Candidatus Falkowbacteria bacterium RIFCSPLOWO2_12_FULL_45_13]
MAAENKINEVEQIKKLLEKNLEYSKEIYRMTKKIRNYVNFQKVISLIYLLLIVVPLILGLIYLPPLLKGVFDQYKDIFGAGTGEGASVQDLLKGPAGNVNLDDLNIDQLPESVRKLLDK